MLMKFYQGLLGIRNIPVLETTLRRTGVVKVWASHDYTRNVAGFRLWALYGAHANCNLHSFFTYSC